jgi:hypothetical protein
VRLPPIPIEGSCASARKSPIHSRKQNRCHADVVYSARNYSYVNAIFGKILRGLWLRLGYDFNRALKRRGPCQFD